MKEFTPKKRTRSIKIAKSLHRKYHIEDLNLIIRILYPKRKSINKYECLLTNETGFTQDQRNLVLEVAHSLTVINELYRDQDKFERFYVCREDMFNAIFMLQNELGLSKQEYLLGPNVRWFYKQVRSLYFGKMFTSREVQLALRVSKTTCQ